MAYQQIHPENAGFIEPGNGFTQLRDAQNPAAIAYARHMLALHGQVVPHGADPTALWRVYSARLAAQRGAAEQAAANESPDMGVMPGSIPASLPTPGVSPHLPDGGAHLPFSVVPGANGTRTAAPGLAPFTPPRNVAGAMGQYSPPPAPANLIRAILAARLAGRGGVPGAE